MDWTVYFTGYNQGRINKKRACNSNSPHEDSIILNVTKNSVSSQSRDVQYTGKNETTSTTLRNWGRRLCVGVARDAATNSIFSNILDFAVFVCYKVLFLFICPWYNSVHVYCCCKYYMTKMESVSPLRTSFMTSQ